jgi:hypothetical protein
MKRLPKLLEFMCERHEIYLRRKEGQSKPWTKDEILQRYRFCNVYRELDRTTIWVRRNIREKFATHPTLWFFLCVARQINHPATLWDMLRAGALPRWDYRSAMQVMRARAQRGEVVYGSAYLLVGGIQALKPLPKDKPEFTCKHVLEPIWHDRAKLTPFMDDGLQAVTEILSAYFGWGGFLAYEVACDLRYTRYLRGAADRNIWANPGPGARRGLNRLAGRVLQAPLSVPNAVEEMRQIKGWLSSRWPYKPALEMREVEHSLCEFDKYERVRLGQGRPRQTYPGQA